MLTCAHPRHPQLGRWLVSLTCISLLVGCGADGPPIQAFELQHEAITGGDIATETTASVFNLLGKANTCTASLIAPNLILTAMHCVAPPAIDSDFVCKYDGTITQNQQGAGALSKTAIASTMKVHGGIDATDVLAVGKTIITTSSNHICKDDLALIVLEEDIDDLPVMQLRLDDPVVPGELATAVGYGTTGGAGMVARRERTGLTVLQVGGEDESTVPSAAPPHTFTLGPGACQGDSGGPAIAEDTGAIIGVYSIGLGACTAPTAINIYTRLAAFRGIILKAFEQAGHEPWFEGEDGPGIPVKPEPAASQTAEPAPSQTAEPAPTIAPDAGVPTTPTADPSDAAVDAATAPSQKPPAVDAGKPEEEDDEPPSGRRLKSGCALSANPEHSSNSIWVGLSWLLAVGLRRSRRLNP